MALVVRLLLLSLVAFLIIFPKNLVFAQKAISCVPAYFIDNQKKEEARLFSVSFDADIAHLHPITILPISNAHISVSVTGDTVYIVHGRPSAILSTYIVSEDRYTQIGEIRSNGKKVGKVTQVATTSKGELYIGSSSKNRLYKVEPTSAQAQDLGRVYIEGTQKTIKISGGDLAFTAQDDEVAYIATKGNNKTTGNRKRGIYKTLVRDNTTLTTNWLSDCSAGTTGLTILDKGKGNLLYSDATTNRFYEVDRQGNALGSYRAYLDDEPWDIGWGDMSVGCFMEYKFPEADVYWSLDGCQDGELLDASGNYILSSYGYPQPDVGYLRQGRSFDGTDDYLEQTSSDFSAQSFTFSLWFKSDYTGDFQTLLSKQITHANRNYWLSLWKQGTSGYVGGAVVFRATGTTGSVDIGTTESYTDGLWHHVAISASASEVVLYVDGIAKARQSGIVFSTVSSPLTIGVEKKNTVFHRFFKGSLDELRFYKEPLTASAIDALSNQETAPEECLRIACGSAIEVVSFTQGLQKNGSPVATNRSEPTKALGIPQRDNTINFVSLGYGGELILRLADRLGDGPGADLEIVETSFDNRTCGNNSERALIYGSQDGSLWKLIGESCVDTKLNLSGTGLNWIEYVKIVDITDAASFGGSSDAFDVDGVVCLNGVIDAPIVDTPPVYCQGDPIQPLVAHGEGILRWYADLAGTQLLWEGNTYQPTISSTTTFYVRQENGAQISSFAIVEVVILPPPTVTYTSFIEAALGETVSFDVIGTASSYRWTYPNGTISTEPNPFITVTNDSYGEYTLVVSNGSCEATYTALIAKEGIFATLKEDLDASYYHTSKEGNLYFKFDEKYGVGTLGAVSVSIFDYDFREVVQQSLHKEYGYNWYRVDLSSVGIEGDYYVIHIKDEWERRYTLRVQYVTGNDKATISEDSRLCLSDGLDRKSVHLSAKNYVDSSPYDIYWYTSTNIEDIDGLEELSFIERQRLLFWEEQGNANQNTSADFITNTSYNGRVYALGEGMYYVRAIIVDHCGNEIYSNTITVETYIGEECQLIAEELVPKKKHRFELFIGIRRLFSPTSNTNPAVR